MIKVSEIKGRAVIGLEQAQKIGTLQGLVIDPHGSQALGLKVAGLEGKNSLIVPAAALYRIGPDAITVREAGVVRSGADVGPLQELPDSHSMADTKVVTDGGTFLGTITDIYVDETSLQVMGYELAGQGWENLLGKGKFLRAQPGFRYGGDLMLVPDGTTTDDHAGGAAAERPADPGALVEERPADSGAPVAAYAPSGSRPQPPGLTVHNAPTESVAQMPAGTSTGASPARYVVAPSTNQPITDAQGNPHRGSGPAR